jgi:hypothetical protein
MKRITLAQRDEKICKEFCTQYITNITIETKVRGMMGRVSSIQLFDFEYFRVHI